MRLNIQIERENRYNYVKINTDDYEKIEEALSEVCGINTGGFGYNPRERHKLKYELQNLFDNHSDFYSHIGFEGGTEHGPTGQTFDTEGFVKFLREFADKRRLRYIEDEEKLQLFCDAIADRLAHIIDQYDDELEDESYVAKSSISVDAEPSGRLHDPELLDEAVVVTDDSVHKLRVDTVEDAETLQDVKDEVAQNTRGVYERQVEARVNTLKERVNSLQNKLESERRNMLIKGIEMVNELEDWKVEDGYLKYQKTINVETVLRENGDNPVELTEEAQEKFYIDGLKVPIRDTISRPKYEDAYHPHALGHGTCTGSFSDKMSKEGLRNVVKQFTHADLHNTNHTEAERDLKENWEEYRKTVENEEGEEEEVTQEVWEA